MQAIPALRPQNVSPIGETMSKQRAQRSVQCIEIRHSQCNSNLERRVPDEASSL